MALSKKDSDFRNKIIAENTALRQQLADGETTYRVQNKDQWEDRWSNYATPTTDRAKAEQLLAIARERYSNHQWRIEATTVISVIIA